MTLQFAPPTPAEHLQYASESLADLFGSGLKLTSNFVDKLKELMPDIRLGFASVKDELDAPKTVVSQLREAKLSRDQDKFLRIAQDVPYSELRGMQAHVPAGLSATYLELLAVLTPATEYLMGVRAGVIEPYMMQLAKLVSDKKGTVSSVSHAGAFKKLADNRKELGEKFAKCYRNGDRTDVALGKVIERNADWKAVFAGLNTVTVNLEAIDLPGIQKQIAQCSDYLGVLHEQMSAGEVTDATREAAQGLADGAYAVGQEMQFLASVYFRAMQLNQAVNDTMANVVKNLG